MKRNLGRKLLALLLTVTMLFGMVPAMSLISAAETVTWTKCANRFTEEDGIIYLDIFLRTRSQDDAAMIPEIAEDLFAEKENYTWKLTVSDTTAMKTEVYTVLPAAYCILNNGIGDYPAFRFAVCGGETNVFTPAYNHSYKCTLDIYAEDALLYSTGEMAQSTCTVEIIIKWSLEDGVLTIHAGVEMDDYNDWDHPAPWYSYRDEITSVVLEDGVTRIGSYAFNECTSLTSVTIPDSVTFIGWDAFEWCSSLTSVTIGDGVKSIGYSAFSGCTSLTSVTIGDSVTSIGECAFVYCSSLTSVTIPNSVTSIGEAAFADCSSLTAITVAEGNPSYCSIDGILYSADKTELICCPAGKAGSVTVPDSVTGIGDYAFEGCTSLTSVTIGNSVTSIGRNAFAYCSSLTSVTIPDSVTSIGSYAFYDCTSLTSVTIGNSVTGIGYDAFRGCSSLTSVTIPNSVTSIGEAAFEDCTSLTSVTIGNSVTSIGEYAFAYCFSLTSVTLGSHVTTIGDSAFFGCSKLVEVINRSHLSISAGSSGYGNIAYYAKEVHTGSSKIVEQDGYLFYPYNGTVYLLGYAGSDTALSLPDNYQGGSYEIYKYAFYDCSSLTSVTIPNSVTGIGNYAFAWCSSLTSVTIGNSVTSIGNWAFEICTSLTSVTIGNSVTSIGEFAFSDCYSLTDIYCEATEQPAGWNEYWLDDCDATVHWGSSGPTEPTYPVLQLNGEQFITEDTIFQFTPAESGTYKFYSTDNNGDPYGYLYDAEYNLLASDDDGNGNRNFKIQYELAAGQTYYLKASFNGGSGSYTVHVEKIDVVLVPIACDDAITISKDTIFQFTPSESGEYRFYVSDYTGLGYLTAQFYPEDHLSERVFGRFSSFKEGLEAGKTYYLYVGFVDDPGYPSTGDALTEGVYAINAKSESCTVHLKKIEPVRWSLEDGVLTVYAGVEMDDYNGWDNLAPWYSRRDEITSVVLEDGVTRIGDHAFNECSSLTSVTIPDSVTSIGEGAFSDCTSLTSITVAEGNPSYCSIDGILYSVDKTELIYCPAGKAGHVTIPDGVISIGRSAFYECSSLTSVTIGNSVTSIGSWAFYDCSALTSVTIGNSVTDIGEYAFHECSSLTTITVAEDNTAYCSMDGILYSADKTELIFCPAGKAGHVTIPDSVTRIGNDAFSWCSSLTSVTIPDSVTGIGEAAFEECTSLTSVTIGNSVTDIGRYAFWGCSSLTSVTLGNSVTGIGYSAFAYCFSLTDIYCEAAEQPAGWNEYWLDDCDATVHWGWKGEEKIPGDINGDKVLSIQDVTVLLLALAKPIPGDGNIALYDVSGDSVISIQDVTVLLQLLAKAA